jgi:hypothetical protein
MRAFYLDDSVTPAVGIEIQKVEFMGVDKLIDTGGVAMFRRHDFLNSNLVGNLAPLWQRCEIRKNDGTSVIWEGWIVDIVVDRGWVTYSCLGCLRVLDQVAARYKSSLVEGTVTGIAGAVMTDSTAAFTAALVGKSCKFTDTVAPQRETVDPGATTAFTGGADTEVGTHADLARGTTGKMYVSDDTADLADTYGIIVDFTLPNFATSNRLEITLVLSLHQRLVPAILEPDERLYYYENESEYPLVSVWDDNGGAYTVNSADMTGEGRINPWYSTTVTHKIIITANVGNYLSGTGLLRIKVTDGDSQATTWLHGTAPLTDPKYYLGIKEAYCENTYSTDFLAKDTVYVVDAQTATTLTFTGQNPETAGVAVGDLYTVGDTLDSILTAMNVSSGIQARGITMDVDATADCDASDYSFAYYGHVLRSFATQLARRVYQAVGWTIKCKTTYTASGMSLTEADIDVNLDESGWTYHEKGTKMIKDCIVSGANIEARSTASSQYGTPQTKIINEPMVQDQATAQTIADAVMAKNAGPVKGFSCLLDLDAGITNSDDLDVGKTIDLNLFSGTVTITTGLISMIRYWQVRGGHLMAMITIEVV